MANVDIGSLDFKLHIDDKEFNKSVDAALQKAQQLNTSMSTLLDIRRQYNRTTKDDVANAKNANRVLREENKTREMNRREIIRTRKELVRLNAEKARAAGMGSGGNLSSQLGVMNSLTSLAAKYVSLWGAASLVKNIANVTAEFELQRIALRAMIGDVLKADQVYGKIWDLALRSPFNAKELASYAKQLVAYSIPVEQLYETTKMLADVSAGLGVGMDRLVLAYGQIRSASFLRGQEVRQLTEAGIPILEELRKQFVELGEEGIKAGDVFDKISKRLVPFEMVEKVFKNLTSEGGKFYQMQEVQAETLKGKIMILKDAYDKLFNTIGENNSGMLKGAVEWITSLARNYEKTMGVLKTLIATYGAYRTTLALASAGEAVIAAVSTVKRIVEMSRKMKALTGDAQRMAVMMRTLGEPAIKKGFATLAGAIAMVATAIVVAIRNAGAFNRELDKIASQKFVEASRSVNNFEKLANELKKATKGSQDYRDAISKLNSQYGDYLPNLLNEKNALDEITKSYNNITNAIYANAKAYAYEEAIRKTEEKYGTKLADAQADAIKAISEQGFSQNVARSFVLSLTQAMRSELTAPGGDFFRSQWKEFFGSDWKSEFYVPISPQTMAELYNMQKKLLDAQAEAAERIDLRFSNVTYSTALEAERISNIVEKYEKNVASIKNKELPADKVENQLLEERKRYLNEIIAAYKKLEEEAQAEGKGGSWINKIHQYENELKTLESPDLSWLQKIVNPIAEQMKEGDLEIKDRAETISSYADKIQKEYKSAAEDLTIATGAYQKISDTSSKLSKEDQKKVKDEYESAQNRVKTLQMIASALGIVLKEPSGSSTKSKAQKEIEHRISILKEFEGWYDKLKDLGLDDNNIREILAAFFPDEKLLETSSDFRTELMKLADDLEKFDKDAAESLRNDVFGYGMDDYYDKLKKSIEKSKKLQEEIKKLKDETIIEGTGVSFDLSKVIHDYQKSMTEAADKFNDERAKVVEALADGDFKGAGDLYDAASKWYNTQTQNAMNKAIDSVDNLADKYIKEWAKIQGIDLEHWSDLSIAQMKRVKRALEELFDEDGNLVGNIAENLKSILVGDDGDLTFYNQFVESLKQYLGDKDKGLYGKWFDEIDTKRIKLLKQAAQAVSDLADSIQELGEASGNDDLKAFSKDFSSISEIAKSAGEGAAAGGWIGAIVGGLVAVGKQMIEDTAHAEALSAAIRNAQTDGRILAWQNEHERVSASIFGDDDIKQMEIAVKNMAEINKEYKELLDNTLDIKAQHDRMKNSQEVRMEIAIGDIAKYEVRTLDRWWGAIYTGGYDRWESLGDLAVKLNMELYDAYGHLNADTLQAILDTYGDLHEADKKWITAAIKLAKQYNEEVDKVKAVVESLAGQVLDTYADKVIDQWVEMGSAAASYADILDDVARAYGKMMVKNILMDAVFNDDLTARLTQLLTSGDTEGFMKALDDALANAASLAPTIAPALEKLNEYFQASGSNALSGGIKGITEDTANLLASYLNGIRGDMILNREAVISMKDSFDKHIPTIDDNIAKIEAHTADIKANTGKMLDEIYSLVTTSSGEARLKVSGM